MRRLGLLLLMRLLLGLLLWKEIVKMVHLLTIWCSKALWSDFWKERLVFAPCLVSLQLGLGVAPTAGHTGQHLRSIKAAMLLC